MIIIRKKDGGSRLPEAKFFYSKDSCPLPRTDDTLDCLGGASYFSVLVLVLVLIRGIFRYLLQKIKNLTQLHHFRRVYGFKVMSFGLTNAPSTFQRLIEFILRGLQWKICLVNIDDISIFPPNFEDHLKHLATVFDRLRDAGLKHKPSKCYFGCFRCHTIPYLGFIATPCMIKIFRGDAGVVTPSNPLPPTNNFFLYPSPVFGCFCKDHSMTPHHPTSSILNCYPLPIHHPVPPKNFDHTPPGYQT